MKEPILIAGAGIGGLTLALALEQRGFRTVVLEQASKLEEVGAGLQISSNGTRALASIGLLEDLRAIAVEPEGKKIRLWNTGESWSLFDLGPMAVAEFGFPYLMVHRGDLHTVLMKALIARAPDALRLGHKVVGFEQDGSGVHVTFADGSSTRGSMLIGADGVHSTVRRTIFGEGHAEFTGCMAWRGVIDASRLPDRLMRPPLGVNWVGPGRHVITYPLRNGTLMNFVGVVESSSWQSESWTARGTREECSADFAGWHPDVHLLIDNVDEHFRWALLSRKPLDQWRIGRVALLGDACHPMLPFMAQGAVMAIEDAIMLARCLEAFDDVGTALDTYVASRIDRATQCVKAADRQRVVFHNDQLSNAEDAATYVNVQWNEERVHERYDWLFSYDVVNCDFIAKS
ncbi:FAD-dependent monooxygenase [soil metagenome]